MKKNKIKIGLVVGLVLLIGIWFSWNFLIPSQDIKKGIKNMRADAVGLNRVITHTLYDGTVNRWEGTIKVYPFPSDSGTGASFWFLNPNNNKKIICGPGWMIEEQ
jgi:hypothetical protein